jgi:F-type H+-transporting ATPase subunit gamma
MRLAEIERRVASMQELQRIVGAMRAIASMRMQEAVRALASVREYGGALAEAIHDALAITAGQNLAESGSYGSRNTHSNRMPVRQAGKRAIVLFASEHGFVGGFNQRLIEVVESDLLATDALMIVGSRGAALAAEHGHCVAWEHPLATRLAGIADTVRLVEEALLSWIARGEIVRAEVVFSRDRRSGELVIERRRLLPIELTAARGPRRRLMPLHDLPAPQLLEGLTAEYMLAQLTEAATEALAAENAARFAAMESARDNVGRKLRTQRLDASRSRQEEVTNELLELVTGEQSLEERSTSPR